MAKIKIKSVTKGSAPSASTVQNSTLEPDIENGDQLNTIDILPTNDPSQVPEYDVDQQFVMPPPDDHGTVLPPPVEVNLQCPVPPPPKPLPPPPKEPIQCPFPPPPPPFLPPSPCCSGGTTQVVDNVLVQTDDPEKITIEEGTYRGMKVFKIGATTFQGIGTTGMVPKPGPDDADKFLDSNGNWTKIVIRQSDWNQDDPTEIDYIKNRPDIDAMIAEETSRAEAAEAAATTEVVQGENVTVDLQIAQDGHRVYTVNADEKQDPLTFDGEYDPLTNPVATVSTVTAATENKADKVSHGVEGNFAALGNDGNLVDSGIKPNSDPSSNDFSTDVPTGGAVLSIVNGLDADIVSNDGTNVQVHIVETDGKITGVSIDTDNTASRDHIHGNLTNDGKIGQTPDLAVVTGANGAVTTSDLTTADPVSSGTSLDFITSVSQDSKGKITANKAALPAATTTSPGIVQITNDLNPQTASNDEVPSAQSVSYAIVASSSSIEREIARMHEDDHLSGGGKYITSLYQINGDVTYTVDNMDTAPVAGSKKPVTSGGIYTGIDNERLAREHFDTWIAERVPNAASGQNQLADKAYVDDLGERLEARYLAYSPTNLPFPSYAAFDLAKANEEFYYDGKQDTPNNNDVIVITSDESKTDLSTTGNPPTTRYRYIAHRVQAMDNDVPIVDSDNKPVWVVDDNGDPIWSGEWFFEYVINNSALNQSQLAAIDSGITSAKVGAYDAHLANHDNPHLTTFEQVASRSDITTSASEVNILSGATIDTSELNTLHGIDTNHSVQEQLDGKADRVLPANQPGPHYDPQGSIVVVSDTADVNGRYNIEDSGAKITQYYNGSDTVNPATGSAIKQAIDSLDAEKTSTTGTNVNVTVVQTDGKVTDVIMSDNSASAAQGALADSAIQKVKVTDIQNGTRVTTTLPKSASDGNAVTIDLTDYKHLQAAVSDPTASGTTLDFISNVSQNAEGVITASKKSVTVDTNYNAQSNNPASGAAIADALNGLGATETGNGSLVNVTVVTSGGDVESVSVDDSAIAGATDTAIDDKINALDVNNTLSDGKYITSLSEVDGKIVVSTGDMDTVPTTGSQKPVTSGGVKTAIDSLHGSVTGEGALVNVTVTTEGGEVTSVSVDDGDIVTATGEAIQQAIDGLDVGNTLSPGTYITSLSEADGKIQVSTENMDTTPTANSVKPVTSGGVRAAIGSAVESLDYTDTPVAHQFVTGVNETDGVISVNRAQPVISDVSGLASALDSKADKITGTFDAGNLVTVDENGNIVASDISPEDVKLRQTAVTETIPDSVTIFSSIHQDENGDITVSTSPIREAGEVSGTYHSGLMTASDKEKLDGLETSLDEKADKVDGAVVGDLASLDSQGNLEDSGINLADVITGVSIMLDDGGISTKQSLVSGHEAILEETTDAEVSRILAALH